MKLLDDLKEQREITKLIGRLTVDSFDHKNEIKECVHYGAKILPPLLKFLNNWIDTVGVKWLVEERKIDGVIIALGLIGDNRAVEPLIRVFEKDVQYGLNSHLAGKCVEALGKIGDMKAVAPLLATLNSPKANVYVLDSIIVALARMQVTQAIPIFEEITRSGGHWLGVNLGTSIPQTALEAVEGYRKGKKWDEEVHPYRYTKQLACEQCGKMVETKEWPARGDRVDFFFMKSAGGYNIKMTCPHCGNEWYVSWGDNPY